MDWFEVVSLGIQTVGMGNVHVFAHIPNHKFQIWKPIKDASSDYPKNMHIHPVGIAQGRKVKPRSSFPHQLVNELVRRSRVNVYWGLQIVGSFPKHIVTRIVIEDHSIPI
jgi:hypothetical protein